MRCFQQTHRNMIHICMIIYIYIYLYIHIYIHKNIHAYIPSIYIHMRVYIYTYSTHITRKDLQCLSSADIGDDEKFKVTCDEATSHINESRHTKKSCHTFIYIH